MKELLEKIKKKLKEVKSIGNLSSKDFRFKNWHASTINLLKNLPSDFILDVNDFKKLTFTDTKYHRGKKFFNPADDTRYREDLDSAVKILKKITLTKKEVDSKEEIEPEKAAAIKKEIKAGKKTSLKIEPAEKTKTKDSPSIKKAEPAKKGKSSTRIKPARKTKTSKSVSTPKKPSAGKKSVIQSEISTAKKE